MSETERREWARRWAEGDYHARSGPSALVAAWAWRLPKGRALDLACGNGRNALYLAEMGFTVDAVDIAPAALKLAQDAARERGLAIHPILADLDEYPLPVETYDLITTSFYINRNLIPRVKEALKPGGFVLPPPPRDSRTFPTPQERAVFAVSPLDVLHVPEGRLLLQTMRSHDQFNTTIYGLDDRYRGVRNGRRVVFVHPDDITALGFTDGDLVDLVSEWRDPDAPEAGDAGVVERCAPAFRIVSYDQPRGCAAAYYPETNPLIPLASTALGSNTPTSKSVVVRLEPAGRR